MSLPGQPTYDVVLPFTPVGVSIPSPVGSTTVSEWKSGPARLDLSFYAGDDITIPLLFRDPNDPAFDMSDQANWDWYAQIRTKPSPWALLVNEFVCTAEYIPPAGEITYGQTKVTLYLAREKNYKRGSFAWDLQSISPSLAPEDPEDPTPGVAHTWLSGKVVVEGEVTHLPGEWPPGWETLPPSGTSVFLAITTGTGQTVGPTGQVG